MHLRLLVIMLVITLMPGLAMAATMTLGPIDTTTPIGSTLTDWSALSLSFPQFDSTLGTLTMVQLNLSGSLSTVLTVTNNSPSQCSGTAKTELQIRVEDGGGNLGTLLNPQLDLNSPFYSYDLASGTSSTSDPLVRNGISSDQYTLAAVLAEFTGPGAIVLPANSFTQTWISTTSGNVFATQVTNASLTGTVTYTYVPEPSSLVGLAGMLVPAAFMLRRRRA